MKVDTSGLVWHFTGPNALYSILRPDGGLLATHQAFMNDPSDCSLSRRVQRLFAEFQDRLIPAPDHELPNEYVAYKEGLRTGASHSLYLACFSAACDNPLLWRCYTRQGGFAIGVSKSELQSHLDIPKMGLTAVRFDDCSYDRWEESSRKVDSLETIFRERWERLNSPDCSAKEKARMFFDSMHDILTLEKELAFVKHPFFKSEVEFRVLYSFKDYVPIADMIVLDGKPRIKIPLTVSFSSLVKEILVSPLGDKDTNFKMAQLLAASIGLPMSNVAMFDAPIR